MRRERDDRIVHTRPPRQTPRILPSVNTTDFLYLMRQLSSDPHEQVLVLTRQTTIHI